MENGKWGIVNGEGYGAIGDWLVVISHLLLEGAEFGEEGADGFEGVGGFAGDGDDGMPGG